MDIDKIAARVAEREITVARVAGQLGKEGLKSRRVVAKVFATKEELAAYLKKHPKSDKSKHSVGSPKGKKAPKKDDAKGGKGKDEKAPAKGDAKKAPANTNDSDGPSKPHGKKSVSDKAVNKVKNILNSHSLTKESDEMKEMAGFKSGLGQRVPSKDVGKWYARNVAQLKADFLKNMSPSNYKDAAAFKAAKDRMKSMPSADFAKILAAITDEEE
jgi:hypothetical protein